MESTPGTHNEPVSNAMTRNRFDKIMKCTYCCDPEEAEEGDRCVKIRPFMEKLNKCFMKYQPTEKKADVDGSRLYHILAVMEQLSSRLCIKNLFVLATKHETLTISLVIYLLLMFTKEGRGKTLTTRICLV